MRAAGTAAVARVTAAVLVREGGRETARDMRFEWARATDLVNSTKTVLKLLEFRIFHHRVPYLSSRTLCAKEETGDGRDMRV